MAQERKYKALWVDEELGREVAALADFQRRTIRSVVEHALKKAIKDEAEKNG
jgi:hypothetical protein